MRARAAAPGVLGLAVALAAAAPAGAQHDAIGHGATGATAQVGMGFNTFSPLQLDVLVGDAVRFRNASARVHTVTADDGSFDSGRVVAGSTFERRFTAPGTVPYHCTLHPGMVGEVRARSLLLTAPAAAAAAGRPYPVAGRAAAPAGTAVTVLDEGGTALGTGSVREDGTFTATVLPRASTTLRATAGGEVSEPVPLLVLDRRITSTAQRRAAGVAVAARVTPASPRAHVVLQLLVPERFGWWPVRRARLDASSTARFLVRTRRRLRARVVLTLHDGATVLATSETFRVGRATRPRHGAGHPPRHR